MNRRRQRQGPRAPARLRIARGIACIATLVLTARAELAAAQAEPRAARDAPPAAIVVHDAPPPRDAPNNATWTEAPEWELRVEGEPIDGAVARYGELWLLPIGEIVDRLGGDLEWDREKRELRVRRAQDGARFRVKLDTGEVMLGEESLGFAPVVPGLAEHAPLRLPQMAVEALTGTHIAIDAQKREIAITLDERLRPVFGFEITLQGRPLAFATPEPRSVGSVLLLPLEPIAKALGHELRRKRGGLVVEVVRAQDRARISLDLESGLALLDGKPLGIVPNMSFAERGSLLLPEDAIELLTGTHVQIESATNRIRIELDPNISGIRQPGGDILGEAARSPFALEQANYVTGNDIFNRFGVSARHRSFDYALRYETPDLIRHDALEPSFYQLGVGSIAGWQGTLGEYAAYSRELDGLGVARIRGSSLSLPIGDSLSRFALGQPADGARRLSSDRAVTSYRGFVAGTRFYGDGGSPGTQGIELGLTSGLSQDANAFALAGSLANHWEHDLDGLPPAQQDLAIDLGHFQGGVSGNRPDARGDWGGRIKLDDRLSLFGRLGYDGAEFRHSTFTEPPKSRAARRSLKGEAFDRAAASTQLSWQPHQSYGTGVRYELRRDQLFDGPADRARTANILGLGANARPWRLGPSLNGDLSSHFEQFETDPDQRRERLVLSATQTWRELSFQLSHHRDWVSPLGDGDPVEDDRDRSQASAAYGWSMPLATGGFLQLTPAITGALSSEGNYADATAATAVASPRWLGERLALRAGYSLAAPIYREHGSPNELLHFLTSGIEAVLARWARVDVSYRTDLSGDNRVFVQVAGDLDLAPRRRYHAAKTGTGVLMGSVFLDRNRDGVRQSDAGEAGLAGVPVRLRGTPLGLNTDGQGAFTIQNLRSGLYQPEVGSESLPFDLLVPQQSLARLRVDDGRITQIDIPVVESGQIRGRVFLDRDGDGSYGAADLALEGALLELSPGDREISTGAFGFFAADELEPGRYQLSLTPGKQPVPGVQATAVELALEPGAMMREVDIPISAPASE